MTPPILLATSRVRRHGGSNVVTLTKRVREALDVKLGDFVVFRRYGRSVFLSVIRDRAVGQALKAEREQARSSVGA